MIYLLIAALIWGSSFGLNHMAMYFVTPPLVGLLSCVIGMAMFLPFAFYGPARKLRLSFAGIGLLQLGLMNYFYQSSFAHLEGHLVALLSLSAPLYVGIFADLFERRRPWQRLLFAAISIAACAYALGASIKGRYTVRGFVECQAANLVHGLGVVLYGRLMRAHKDIPDRAAFFWMWLGGTAPLLLALFMTPWSNLPETFSWAPHQIAILLYLPIFCGGIANYIWNKGVVAVSSGVLLAFTNLPLVLGLFFGRLLYGEGGNWFRQIVALVVLLALVWLDKKVSDSRAKEKGLPAKS
ncbi:MAG: DMT family transporter [Puniceicoccales bacterium]|jgi:drug/metabolite transporter (DMT)-like permease|nr:DMT family transporter [Puniceicoccales bacterium]